MLNTKCTITQWRFRDACVVLIFGVAWDTLAYIFAGFWIRSTFSVVFAVGVVSAAGVWSAYVAVAVVPRITYAYVIIAAGADAMCTLAASAVGSRALNTLVSITHIAFRTYTVLIVTIVWKVGTDSVWWALEIFFTFD